MAVLSVGWAEVISILVRHRNSGRLNAAQYQQAIALFRAAVGLATPVRNLPVDAGLADRAADFIELHSINSTDAILLRSALDLAAVLRARGDDLILVTSDRRLLRAAQAEGLTA